jgi:hypothetical protein
LQDIYGEKGSVGVSVEIITINEICKVFGSVYFVSEGHISQAPTIVGQVVTEINRRKRLIFLFLLSFCRQPLQKTFPVESRHYLMHIIILSHLVY